MKTALESRRKTLNSRGRKYQRLGKRARIFIFLTAVSGFIAFECVTFANASGLTQISAHTK